MEKGEKRKEKKEKKMRVKMYDQKLVLAIAKFSRAKKHNFETLVCPKARKRQRR